MYEQQVVAALRERGLRIATAESTVGGLIGHLFTEVPGASRVFAGGITAYANDAKERLLHVDAETLREHGSVSEPAALAMARGAREAFEVDIAIAETGIAGPLPSGAAGRYEAGLYFIAISAEGYERVERRQFSGGRSETKQQAAAQALRLVLDYLDSMDAPDTTG